MGTRHVECDRSHHFPILTSILQILFEMKPDWCDFITSYFLRIRLTSAGLVGVAPQTYKRFIERLRRLYEQRAPVERIGDDVRRWQRWAVSGLGVYNNSIGKNRR